MASSVSAALPPPTRDLPSKGPLIVGCLIPLTLLASIFALARLFARCILARRAALDDGIILASLTSLWATTITSLLAVAAGHGQHLSTLTPAATERVMRLSSIAFAFGIFAFALPKFAVVSLVCRLLSPGRWQRVWLWGLVGFCFVVLFGNIPSIFSECQQAAEGWALVDMELGYVAKSCIGPKESVYYSISSSAISAATNMYVALYVALAVPRLTVARRKKMALTTALALGFVALVTAIYKCTRLMSLAGADFTYDAADLVIWTSIEASTIITAASIPVLQPLLDHLAARPPRSSRTPSSAFNVLLDPTVSNTSTTSSSTGMHHHRHRRKHSKSGGMSFALFPLRTPTPSALESQQQPNMQTRNQPRSVPTDVDIEAAAAAGTRHKIDTIAVEHEVEVNYTWELASDRDAPSRTGGWAAEDGADEGSGLQITKNVGPDGRVTTTVAVVRSALDRDRPRDTSVV